MTTVIFGACIDQVARPTLVAEMVDSLGISDAHAAEVIDAAIARFDALHLLAPNQPAL